MSNTIGQLAIFVDIDDTLVRSFGAKRIPIPEMVECVRRLKLDGGEVFFWSSGGSQYALDSAKELGIASCGSAFLPKPNVVIDDVALHSWSKMVVVHPFEASSMSLLDYSIMLSKGTKFNRPLGS